MKMAILAAVASFPLICAEADAQISRARVSPTRIHLQSRTFDPGVGVDPVLARNARSARRGTRIHVIVQFREPPSTRMRTALAEQGVRLLDPIPRLAYFASIPADYAGLTLRPASIRWIGSIQASDRVAPALRHALPPRVTRGTQRAAVIVEFFGDVPADSQRQVLARLGVEDMTRISYLNGWSAIVRHDSIPGLASADAVKWITIPPSHPEVDNEGVRSASGLNADVVLAAPYSVSGAGVVLGHWDDAPASAGHGDFGTRVTVGDPVMPSWARTQAHDETIAPNGLFDEGEHVYRDIDDNGWVNSGDIRDTNVPGTLGVGSTVASGDVDDGTKIIPFRTRVDAECTVPPEMFVNSDNDRNLLWEMGDPIYVDMNCDGFADAGDDPRTTATAPGKPLRFFRTSPHWHATMLVGTMLGSGAGSLAAGYAPFQWKGVAPAAQARSYTICATVDCLVDVWTESSAATYVTTLDAAFVDAGGHGVSIASNAWGPWRSHFHELLATEPAYGVLSELFDKAASGVNADGTPTTLSRFVMIGSAGNQGRPERYVDNGPANNRYDKGEQIWIDVDGDGVVSSDDKRVDANPATDAPLETTLIDFDTRERHSEGAGVQGVFDSGDGIYRDLDDSWTVTAVDERIDVPGFASGTVGSLAGDLGRPLRQFRLFGNLRVPNAAKNTIQVGAVASDALFVPAYGSRGPTRDGRLKPDVLAPGAAVGGTGLGVTSTHTRNRYDTQQGTSMATGAATGAAALIAEWYRTACSASVVPADVLKALMIHGAEDVVLASRHAGVGPDYATGFGRVRVKETIDLVPHHARGTLAEPAEVAQIPITIGRTTRLKVTLVWNDPPWTPNADVSAGILQNDLDLTLVAPDARRHTSWLLDPAAPSLAATRSSFAAPAPVPSSARDYLNPVEQVVVDDAPAGVWTIEVSAALLKVSPQPFTIVSEAISPAQSPCVAAPSGDVWIRDNTGDTGAVPSSGALWLGPDLWNRHTADGSTEHQNPEFGETNFLYANVRNAGTAVAATTMELWIADASTGLSWPTHFTYVGRIFVPNLAAGEVRQIGPLPWQPPAPGASGHFCMYMRLLSPQDPIAISEGFSVGANARNSNNIAYRNLQIVDLRSLRGERFLVRNVDSVSRVLDLSIRAPSSFFERGGDVLVGLPAEIARAIGPSRATLVQLASLRDSSMSHDRLPPEAGLAAAWYRLTGTEGAIRGMAFAAGEARRITLLFRSADAEPASHDIDVVQWMAGREIGGIRYVVRTGRRR